MTITYVDARERVDGYLVRVSADLRHEVAVLEWLTREEEFGWVFFYNSKRFVETRDMQWALGGNAPLIVDKYTGEIHVTGTAHPIEYYIERYHRNRAQ